MRLVYFAKFNDHFDLWEAHFLILDRASSFSKDEIAVSRCLCFKNLFGLKS
jgi:hypothetical protein